jgi:DNA-binding MarR family transcriptional regulator
MATKECIKKLDNSFFKVRFERLTPKEKEYLYALAQMGEGQHRSGDIASKLGVKTPRFATIRDSLMKKGMIYSPSYGDTEFTVPLFDEFMKRAMRD